MSSSQKTSVTINSSKHPSLFFISFSCIARRWQWTLRYPSFAVFEFPSSRFTYSTNPHICTGSKMQSQWPRQALTPSHLLTNIISTEQSTYPTNNHQHDQPTIPAIGYNSLQARSSTHLQSLLTIEPRSAIHPQNRLPPHQPQKTKTPHACLPFQLVKKNPKFLTPDPPPSPRYHPCSYSSPPTGPTIPYRESC